MNEKLKRVLKRIPGLRKTKQIVERRISDIPAIVNMLIERRIDRGNGPVKVAFLCQYIPAWNKSELLYRGLANDSRFEVFLVCIPSGIRNNELINKEETKNDTYEYYKKHGYEVINALTAEGEWFDLRGLQCDYVFYLRPYNDFMPKQYVSSVVSRYSKVCAIMYAITLSEELYGTTLNRDFFDDVALYFAETPDAAKRNKQNFWFTHKWGLRKSQYLGSLVLEQIIKDKHADGSSWMVSDNRFKIMWTPRWTTDKKSGGSNFFVYHKLLMEYASKNKDVDVLIRPHPLMFDNFIRTGEMTIQEVEEYKETIKKSDNVKLDEEKEYIATMWGASVLISDYSSMVPEYFVTGKPLIFCISNMHLELTEYTRCLLEGCYIAHTSEEMFRYLERLKRGEDPLAEKRMRIIDEMFKSTLTGTTDRIIDVLASK